METAQPLSPAEIIQHMNREGIESTQAQPAQQQPAPTQQTQEPPPPIQKKEEEVVIPGAPKETKKEEEYKVPEPAFIRKDDKVEPPAEAKKEGAENVTPPATQEPAPAADDAIVYNRLSELTEGTIKSEEDLVGLISQYNELVEQAEAGFEPKFTDERMKWAYQLLTQNPESALETAERTIHALRLKEVDKMEPRDALFNAFLLDPKNYDLTQSQAAEYFAAEFEEKYKDLENNPLMKRKLDVDAREARQAIQKIQSEFKATEAQPQQVSQDVIESVSKTVENFGGVKIAFTENPKEDDFLTIPVENEEQIKALQENALRPDQWLNNLLNQFQTKNGFDYEGYIRERFEMENHKMIRQMAFQEGLKKGRLEKINEDRNASTKEDIAKISSGAPPAVKQEGSFYSEWGKAVGVN